MRWASTSVRLIASDCSADTSTDSGVGADAGGAGESAVVPSDTSCNRATAARARASMAVDWFWARSNSSATSLRNDRT